MTNRDPRSPTTAAVIGVGASSAIGHGVRPIQAAMAAGLRNFQEGDIIAPNGEPARSSRLPDLDQLAPRGERLALLTRLAAIDLMTFASLPRLHRIHVHVGLASDAPRSDLDTIARALEDGSDGSIELKAANVFGYRNGRIAFLSALAGAMRVFETGAADHALVVAVDSRCTEDAIDALMRERRLLTDEDDGAIPGEGAVIALVARPGTDLAAQHTQFVVGDPAFGRDEFETIRQSPQATQGLGRAFRTLREQSGADPIRPAVVIAFETGELFFTRAFATGYLRNVELMPEPLRHELIATNVGDTGAAAAGFALIRADWMMRHLEGSTAPRILVYGHADDGSCAATMVARS